MQCNSDLQNFAIGHHSLNLLTRRLATFYALLYMTSHVALSILEQSFPLSVHFAKESHESENSKIHD